MTSNDLIILAKKILVAIIVTAVPLIIFLVGLTLIKRFL
jgi:hypothetical protein